MLSYDVIVVGAGPAGASAAHDAAAAGMRVLLLEKHPLPRHKTCGGGMPMTVGEELRGLAPEAFVESEVRFMRHTWEFDDPYLATINPSPEEPEITLWMVQRSVFDNALAQRAAAAGADLRDGLAVRSVENNDGAVTVRAAGQAGAELVARAPQLIGADGANGVCARAAGLRRSRMLAIALEVEHPYHWGNGHADLRRDVIHLEYGAIRRGYAWIFPKADHLNVGAGVFRPRSAEGRGDPSVRDELQRAIFGYLDSLGVPYSPNQMCFHAHPLPIWNGKERVSTRDGGILLVGDAAGLINPLFGDGILHAVRSGRLAAQCVAEGAAREYTRRLHAEFAPNFDAALKLAKAFYQWTGFIYKHGVMRPGATRSAARLLAGQARFADAGKRALKLLRQSMGVGRLPEVEPEDG